MICSCCGQKIVIYRHNLSKILAQAMFNKAYGRELTNSQYCNWHKLKYWGLIGEDSELTGLAYKFLSDEIKLPKMAETFRGKVKGFIGREIYIHEISDEIWRKTDYARNSIKAEEESAGLFDV